MQLTDVATVLNVAATLALVAVTYWYVRLTRDIGRASAVSAEAARRSAEAAERSLQVSGAPGISVIGEVQVPSVPPGEGGRWPFPIQVKVPIENVGPGVAFNVSATVNIGGAQFLVEGPFQSRVQCMQVGDDGGRQLEARPPAGAPESTREAEIEGTIEVLCEDVFGNTWSTTWQIRITPAGGSLGSRAARRVSEPAP